MTDLHHPNIVRYSTCWVEIEFSSLDDTKRNKTQSLEGIKEEPEAERRKVNNDTSIDEDTIEEVSKHAINKKKPQKKQRAKNGKKNGKKQSEFVSDEESNNKNDEDDDEEEEAGECNDDDDDDDRVVFEAEASQQSRDWQKNNESFTDSDVGLVWDRSNPSKQELSAVESTVGKKGKKDKNKNRKQSLQFDSISEVRMSAGKGQNWMFINV